MCLNELGRIVQHFHLVGELLVLLFQHNLDLFTLALLLLQELELGSRVSQVCCDLFEVVIGALACLNGLVYIQIIAAEHRVEVVEAGHVNLFECCLLLRVAIFHCLELLE